MSLGERTISRGAERVSAGRRKRGLASRAWLHRTTLKGLGAAGMLGATLALGGCFLDVAQIGPASVTDVTSNLENPPAFQALAAERRQAGFPATYPGGETAMMQKYAHPEIKPLSSSLPPAAAYAQALDLVRQKGWTVAATVPPGFGQPGLIEATAKPTPISQPDDIIVRLTPEKHGTRVDMRSAARHDRRDLGVNARRVSGFMFELRDILLSANAK